MRVKTFEASTLQDALARAKRELGDEAVVLNTREVTSRGLFGLRHAGSVALTAAADDRRPVAPPSIPPSQGGKQAISPPYEGGAGGDSRVCPGSPIQDRELRISDPVPGPRAAAPDASSEIADLRWELQRLSLIVENLMGPRAAGGRGSCRAAAEPLVTTLGIDDDLAHGPLSDLLAIADPETLTAALAAKLQPFACPPSLDEPRVIALVGPTGVGKTTTLAKLAARFSLEMGKKVALVTVDTFRIGAVEQLKTYARIMGLPLEVSLSAEDVAAALEKHRDKDVVLIDTVGRSQRSDDHLKEIKTFLDAVDGIETHLVVAASLDPMIQREVIERFAIFSPMRLVVTKLDESPHRGALVNLPLRTGLGISCVTAGQNVPQDLEFADAGLFARLVVEAA